AAEPQPTLPAAQPTSTDEPSPTELTQTPTPEVFPTAITPRQHGGYQIVREGDAGGDDDHVTLPRLEDGLYTSDPELLAQSWLYLDLQPFAEMTGVPYKGVQLGYLTNSNTWLDWEFGSADNRE